MDMLDAVHLYVHLDTELSDADDDELAEALVAHEISPEDAERILAFVELAFGRVLLSSSRAVFSDTYLIENPDSGRRVRGRFATEPAYVAAMQYAQAHAGEDAIALIGERSSEVQAALKLLPEGAPLGDLDAVFVEPVLLRVPLPERPPSWRRRWVRRD
jgi:hypothetical protein